MTLPFNPNVPLATSSPSEDQPTMLSNSQIWANTWNADGVPIGSSTNLGFSNQRTFVRLSEEPTPDNANGRLLSLEDASGVAQLFWLSAAQDGGGLSQITSAVAGGRPAGSVGYYSYTDTIGSAAATIEQWFWVLTGGLQIKQIRVTQTGSLTTAVSKTISFVGNSGVSAPFSSQAIFMLEAAQSSAATTGSAARGFNGFSSNVSGATVQGAYLDGVYFSFSLGSPNVVNMFIIGI